MRTLACCSAVVVLLLAPSGVGATPNFPEVIRQTLGAALAPPCSVCHAGGQTGRGTVTTPFGQAMLARGLVAYDETSLKNALAQMEADKVDSNGNGVPDVDELRAGTDPNRRAGTPEVQYGCALGGSDGGGLGALAAALVLLTLLVFPLAEGPAVNRGGDG